MSRNLRPKAKGLAGDIDLYWRSLFLEVRQ
jgi:hypothetical protein